MNCKEIGYADDLTKEVWRQIESFGGYSFSKAHSASFAVESYQSLFLKTYYPMEFMVAVINNFGGFYSTELYFHELKRTGARIHAPCINYSQELTSIYGKDVYIGFIHIKSLEKETVLTILEERGRHGQYEHLQDFIQRTDIGVEQLNTLIRVGALRFTGKNKKELLWEANFLQKRVRKHNSGTCTLFPAKPFRFQLPELDHSAMEDALDEIELLGFPLCNVFDLVEADPSLYVEARQISEYLEEEVNILCYYITEKPVRTVKGQLMYFGTFIDANGDWVDTVHFPDKAMKHRLTGKGFYHIRGKVVEEFGVYSIEVAWMEKIGIRSRDK